MDEEIRGRYRDFSSTTILYRNNYILTNLKIRLKKLKKVNFSYTLYPQLFKSHVCYSLFHGGILSNNDMTFTISDL